MSDGLIECNNCGHSESMHAAHNCYAWSNTCKCARFEPVPALSSPLAELAEAKATIARLTVELQKMTRQRDAHKSAAADWAAESKRIKDWGVASIEAVAAEQEPIVEAAKALARTWQQAIADGFNQVDLTMPLNLLVAAVEEGNKT